MRILAIAAVALSASFAAAAPSHAATPFDRIDRNNDGAISRPEWFARHGRGADFVRADRDNDRALSPGEYRRLLARLQFKRLDNDDD